MSDATEAVDAIVVGAGLAGIACAYRLALAGLSVVLVERGASPGSKNVSGGRLYTYALERVATGLAGQAPWERPVVNERIVLMDADRAMTVSFTGAPTPGDAPPASVTVLRSAFDAWFAGRAEAAGALLAPGIRVDSLVEEGGRVVGIQADGEEMRSGVVVAADGVNSLLGRQAGLVGAPSAHAVAIGVKEVIALPAATIEERFAVGQGEGAAVLMLGCTGGVHGGAFLYTNAESLSLGIVAAPDQLPASGRSAHRMLQDLKQHPMVGPLVAGGETVEYSAHLVREDGWRGVPRRLTREGFLVTGEAAGFVMNLGYTVRGMDLALLSGVAAAEAVIEGGDLETAYRAALERSGLPASMRAGDGYTDVLANQRLYGSYPGFVLDLLQSAFCVDGTAAEPLGRQVRGAMRCNGLPVRSVLRDGLAAVRAL